MVHVRVIEKQPLLSSLRQAARAAVSPFSARPKPAAYYPNIAGVDPKKIKGLPPEVIASIAAQQKIEAAEIYAPPKIPKFSRLKAWAWGTAKFLGVSAIALPFAPPLLFMLQKLTFMSNEPLALATLIGGGAFFIYFSLKKRVSLQEANFHSPDNFVSVPNNPTWKKLLRMFVAPGMLGSLGMGTVMCLALPLEIALKCPQGSLGWIVGFGTTVFATLGLESLPRIGRDIVEVYQFYRHRTQRNWPRRKFWGKFFTNLGANLAWLSTFWFYANMCKVYTAHTAGWALRNTLHNFYELITFAPKEADFKALAVHVAFFLVGTIIYYLAFRRNSEAKARPHEEIQLWKKTLVWGATGAGIGLLTYLTGIDTLATNILAGSITLGWMHATLHSLKSQWAALVMAAREDQIFSLTDLYYHCGPRHAAADARTVYRPAFGMIDTLVSAYIMILISEGCNGVINGPSGCFSTQDFIEAQIMVRDLLLKDETKLRQICLEQFEQMEAATNTREALEAVAQMLDRFGYFLDDAKNGPGAADHEGIPRAEGHLKQLSGMGQLKDNLFNARREHTDCDLTVQGQHIRQAARIHHCMAEMFRRYANEVESAELEKKVKVILGEVDVVGSLKRSLATIMDGYYRRSYQHVDVHPVRFWTNVLMADSYNAKQFAIDFCSQVMADMVGVMEVVVMNPNGQIDILPVRMKMVKDFREDYADILSLKGDSTYETVEYHGRQVKRRRLIKNKDARIEWYPRDEHDMKEDSLCEIDYLCNFAHYQKYKKLFDEGRISEEAFLAIYPTDEFPTCPQLKREPCLDPITNEEEPEEFYDLVYKNKARLRVFASGKQVLMVRDEKGAILRLDPLDPANAGYMPNKSAVLLVAGTKGNDYVSSAIQNDQTEAFFRHIKVEKALLEFLKQGKIPHPFGNGKFFDDNPLTMPRWHFMYPTALISVSDGDQMDWAVTNLHLFFLRSNPHLRLIFKRIRKVKLPWSKNDYDLMERKTDALLEAGVAVTWMRLKCNLKARVTRADEVLNILDRYPPNLTLDLLEDYDSAASSKVVRFKKNAPKVIRHADRISAEDKAHLLAIFESCEKGRVIHIPLNMNKENERTFGGELWRGIEQGGKVVIDIESNRLRLPYHDSVRYNPAFDSVFDNQTIDPNTGRYINRQRIDAVPIPPEMQEFVEMIDDSRETVAKAKILRNVPEISDKLGLFFVNADPEEKHLVCKPNIEEIIATEVQDEKQRYRFLKIVRQACKGKGIVIDTVHFPAAGGPVTDIDYIFCRRNRDGFITNADRSLELPDRVAQMLIMGNQLLSKQEIEGVAIRSGNDQTVYQKFPWSEQGPGGEADENIVHLPLTPEEYAALQPWIKNAGDYHGLPPDPYDSAKGELRIRLKHYMQVCESSYQAFSYIRYMPASQYERFFEPTGLTLFYGSDKKQAEEQAV